MLPDVGSTIVPPGLSFPSRLGALDHREADAVLHGAAGVQVLELREQLRLHAAADSVEPHDRRVPDELEDGSGSRGPRDESVRAAVRKRSDMNVAVVGRGNVGGGLADLWERAGHDVARLGTDGGDVSERGRPCCVAVPGAAVADALERVQGIEGKTVIDATNLIGAEPPAGFASNARVRQVEDERPDREDVQPELRARVRRDRES